MSFFFIYLSPLLAIITCILNGTEVVILLRRFKKRGANQNRHKTSLLYLLSLAFSDFLVGLTVVSLKTLTYLMRYRVIYYKGVFAMIHDFMLLFFLRFSLAISIFNLIALTVDRLLSIRSPFRHLEISTRNVLLTKAIIWILSLGSVSVFYYFAEHAVSSEVTRKRYRWMIFPATTVPAVITLSLCYVFIFKAIRGHGKKLKSQGKLDESSKPRQVSLCTQILRREARVAKFVGSVVLTFSLCWLPLAGLGIVGATGNEPSSVADNIAFILAFSNSVANPLIYFGFKNQLLKKWKHRFNKFFRH